MPSCYLLMHFQSITGLCTSYHYLWNTDYSNIHTDHFQPPTQQFYFLSLLSQGRNWDKQTWQNHYWSKAISKTKLATELCFKYVLESQKQSSSKFFLKRRGNCTPVLNSQATASMCLQLCLWRTNRTNCKRSWSCKGVLNTQSCKFMFIHTFCLETHEGQGITKCSDYF